MKHIPDNTLAHYQQLPQTQLLVMSSTNAQLLAHNIKVYQAELNSLGNKLPVPDAEAIQFYLFNHLASLVRERFTAHEPMPDWATAVMREYKQILANQGVRLASYMALITVRESRHMGSKESEWWEEKIIKPFGKSCQTFHNKVKGSSSGGAVEKFLSSPPSIGIGPLFNSIQTMFFHGPFGSSYGGPPWGEIAKCLCQFLDGKTTQEMMIDTAYTLAHNNGPMFNKGMLYNGYTAEFKIWLDVQRSGQIPECVIERGGAFQLTKEQSASFKAAREAIPEAFGTYINWYKVEQDGALGSYSGYKEQQDAKYGKPAPAPKKVVPTTFNGKSAMQVGEFDVVPGKSVPILERV